MFLWASTLALMALLTTVAAQPMPVAVTHWQRVDGGVVTVTTHVVGDIETLPIEGGLRVRGWVVDAFSATYAELPNRSATSLRPDLITVGDLAGLVANDRHDRGNPQRTRHADRVYE